jgi:hypothetical protein
MANPYSEISPAAQRATLRAMATIATLNGTREPKDATRRMIDASAVQLFGLPSGDVDYNPITPAELAGELGSDNPITWLIDLMSLVPFADENLKPEEVRLVDQFAAGLGVKPAIVTDLDRLADERYKRFVYDLVRRETPIFLGTSSKWAELHETARELRLHFGDKTASERYEQLAELPAGTLGNTFYRFYVDRGFAFPGQKDSLGETITRHDSLHILSGCNTDATGEINVAGVETGMVPGGEGSQMLVEVMTLLQDDVSLKVDEREGVSAQAGQLDPEAMVANIRKGLGMTKNLFSHQDFDFWAAVHRDLDDLRQEVGLQQVDGDIIPPPASQTTPTAKSDGDATSPAT